LLRRNDAITNTMQCIALQYNGRWTAWPSVPQARNFLPSYASGMRPSVRPHPILHLFLLLHWAWIWPRLTAGMRQGEAPLYRSVSLQTTSLKLTQRTLRLDTVEISAYAPFDKAAISGRCHLVSCIPQTQK